MTGEDQAPLRVSPDRVARVNFVVLSQSPLIAITNACPRIFRAIAHTSAISGGRPAQLFARVSAEIDWQARHLKDVRAFLTERGGGVRLKFLATNEKAVSVLASLGLDAVVCSPNAFVDENTMYAVATEAKSWDAIYNARFLSVKRHSLAADVASLALIGAPWGTSKKQVEAVHAAVPHAAFLNFNADGQYRNLGRDEVRAYVNRARTGLILSETEGGNLATMEYLLCGVPVVTTPPQGGRELFLPPEVCEVAEPDAGSVADAVRRLILRRLDPAAVRETVLALMRPHRDTFRQEILDAVDGLGARIAPDFELNVPYALLKYEPVPDYGV